MVRVCFLNPDPLLPPTPRSLRGQKVTGIWGPCEQGVVALRVGRSQPREAGGGCLCVSRAQSSGERLDPLQGTLVSCLGNALEDSRAGRRGRLWLGKSPVSFSVTLTLLESDVLAGAHWDIHRGLLLRWQQEPNPGAKPCG